MPFIAATLPTAPSPGNKLLPRVALLLAAGLIGLLLTVSAFAAPTLVLDEDYESRSLAAFTDLLLLAPEDQHSITDILSPPFAQQFRPVENGDLKAPANNHNLWLRFTIHNPTAEPTLHILEVSPANLNRAELYRGSQRLDMTPLPTGIMMRSHQLFSIATPANASVKYHLHLASPVEQPVFLQLLDYASLAQQVGQQELISAVFMGMLLVVVIFTTARAFIFHDKLFLTVSAYTLLTIAYHGFAWGYFGDAQGLLPPWDRPLMAVILLLLAMAELCYGKSFPVFSQDKPGVWPKLFNLMTAALIFAMVTVFFGQNVVSTIIVNTTVSATIILLNISALCCFLSTYSRLILVYLITRTFTVLIYLVALLAYYRDLASPETVNSIFMLISCTTVLIHSALVLARHRQKQHQRADENQRIAVLGEVSRAKTDIVARITHDIRTPLSAMLGASELMQETQLSGAQKDYVRTLQRSSQELLQFLEEAGQTARFNENDIELSTQLINLPELITDTLSSFRNIAAERNLELICDIEHKTNEWVLGDPSRITQLLSHAMNSAFERSEAGHLLLRVSGGDASLNEINFQLSHLGRPFTQQEKNALDHNAPNQDSRINPRFAIIGQLVSLMGGRINARTSPEGINKLHFSLRLSVPKQLPSPQPSKMPELQNRRLLVIDKNQTFCDIISKQCEHWGMVAHSALNEPNALALLHNQKLLGQNIDILLIDYNLPTSTGLAFAQRVYKESAENKAPLMLLLAHSNINLPQQELAAAGIRKILNKPLSGLTLRHVLTAELHYDAAKEKQKPTTTKNVLRCLVAEDNETNAQVLTRMLEKLGITVTLVGNGQQAMNSFMREEFDLIIMDIEMPIMDGVEATRQIRSFELDQRPGRIPIFGLTANALDEQQGINLEAGMDLHLIKPIRLWELREAIKRWTHFNPKDS